ncbi:ASPARAGINE SYNTHETASE [GLUTAMINE-HYDROLYZING] 3 [Salix viminalis]|uniref:ASPARAGINE SYNTHETASE [GLUTAMINE-HYDROLYZING] 3 n=1 Tax=Salix viminalis TaxID=40686 RepID=A0A9Q0SHT6_SALVM|nr:ASPARAGINE SYNTHETASE [GLUTAMINE-HYDROLYZING] 3 [Salix viminalis]
MCGILAVFGCSDNSQAKRARIVELSRRLRHRGPDWSGLHCHEDCYLAHQRLAIVDPASGDQPLYNQDKTVVVTVNGEIYNHKELRAQLKSHTFRTGSDCEVIAHLYEEHGENFVGMLDGMFSFVLLDTRDKSFIAARDAIGITPLYIGWGLDEMKALSDDCERFTYLLPGHIYSSKQGGLRRWYNPTWYSEQIPSTPYDPLVLRGAFEKAVIKRLMTDVPFGVLLSGGLDSSLVAAVASRHLADAEAACQWGSQLHTFCIGLKGSPDTKAAREVADYLGTRHHEFHFTIQEGIDALEEAPNKEEFHQETCQKIKALHLYDCLRANKSTSAWGVEARVPFLDKEFINIAMSIDPEWKMIRPDLGRIEKWILRNAFDDEKNPYLPKHILYRQKEQFSDGVGYSWIDGLKDHANKQVTDSMLMNASFVYPENTPTTKEAYYYRTIFEKFFPKNAARSTVPGGPSVACSTAKAVEWDASWSKNLDPSGRAALGVHAAAYEETGNTEAANLMNGSPQKRLEMLDENCNSCLIEDIVASASCGWHMFVALWEKLLTTKEGNWLHKQNEIVPYKFVFLFSKTFLKGNIKYL